MGQDRNRKVVIGVTLYGAPGRQQFAGVIRYLERRRDWNLVIVNSADELLAEIRDDGADGFIVGALADDRVRAALAQSSVPAALMDQPQEAIRPRKKALAFIQIDNRTVAETAARHFLGLGNFRSFGYVPSVRQNNWSQARCADFATALRRTGRTVKLFPGGNRDDLADWLAKLPKPSAVLAVNDLRAAQTIVAANAAGVSVPKQLAVLGVDDDDVVCNSTRPTISSIRPDHEAEGYEAAKALDRILRGAKSSARTILCSAERLSERESTRTPSPAANLIHRARELIAAEATKGLSPNILAERLGISRRLLDLRFSEFEKTTVMKAITARKLAAFRSLLRSSRDPISRLAAKCGFSNVNALRNLFRRRYGFSPKTARA